MYSPQTNPIPTIDIPGPRVNYPLMRLLRLIIQPYARALKFLEPAMLHGERLVDSYRDFGEGKTRLIIGFRHAYGDDPQLMAYTLHHALPREAKRLKKPIKGITHAHFMYGVEVPLWSGKFVRWLLPNVGAVPINHVHMDSEGMNRIRKTLLSGNFPLALAPEGHVTYESETVSELETGTARFGFWCIEDLARAGRDEKVVFLPVSTHYRYGKASVRTLRKLLEDLEASCGIAGAGIAKPSLDALRSRLAGVGAEILSVMAAYYRELSGISGDLTQEEILDAALSAAERILALTGEGEPFARLYRIRAIAWDRIFRGDTAAMNPLRLNLAGRETGEAWYAMRHMETAELLAHVLFGDVPADAGIHRLFEIANNYYDMIERLKGGTLKNRANRAKKKAVIVPGKPVVINDFYPLYREDRKAALARVTERMREGFEECIREYKAAFD
jgi:hypothetical protein